MKASKLLLLLTLLAMAGCDKDKTKPLSDRIKHVWTAQIVRENTILVYTKGASANIRNYGSFRLDLSSPPTVKLTDFDGTTFAGTYALQGETRLVLSNLQPQPTSSGGMLEFTVNSAVGTALDISRSTSSPKTGNTLNQYQLTSN